MTQRMPVLTALAFLAGAGVMVTATTYAQTTGGDRRDDRRDTRQGSREQKQDCKAGDEKSRPECRQEKRDTKHGDSPPTSSPTPPTSSPTPPTSSPTPPTVAPRRQQVTPRRQQVTPRRQSSSALTAQRPQFGNWKVESGDRGWPRSCENAEGAVCASHFQPRALDFIRICALKSCAIQRRRQATLSFR